MVDHITFARNYKVLMVDHVTFAYWSTIILKDTSIKKFANSIYDKNKSKR